METAYIPMEELPHLHSQFHMFLKRKRFVIAFITVVLGVVRNTHGGVDDNNVAKSIAPLCFSTHGRANMATKTRITEPATKRPARSEMCGRLKQMLPMHETPSPPAMMTLAPLFLVTLVMQAGSATKFRRRQSAVTVHARSPFPEPPMECTTGRRMLAKHGFHQGEQISERVWGRKNTPVDYLMHVQEGDLVQVVMGAPKDKGKVTQVLRVWPRWNRILCLNVNICTKVVRPQRADEEFQVVECEEHIHATQVMHYDPEEQKIGMLGIRHYVAENGMVKTVRYNKATGNMIRNRKPPEWIPVADRVETSDD